jgi:hypothetical protein
MVTSLTQQTADLLDWVENHGYFIEADQASGKVEYRAHRRDGRVHVASCDGDGELQSLRAAQRLAQSVAADITRPARSRLAAAFARWTAPQPPPRPGTA